MMPASRQADSDSGTLNCHRTVTSTVTERHLNYSGFTAGGDTSDSKTQTFSKKKKNTGSREKNDPSTSSVYLLLHFTVTTVTRCHDARNILASGGDSNSDSCAKIVSPNRHLLSSLAGRVTV